MEDTYQARSDFIMAYHGAPLNQCRAKFPDWTEQLLQFKFGSVEEALWVSDFCKKALTLPAKPAEDAKVEEPLRYHTKLVSVIRQAFATAWRINAVEATSQNCLYLAGCEQTDWEEFANSVAPLDNMPSWTKMTAPASTVPVPTFEPVPPAHEKKASTAPSAYYSLGSQGTELYNRQKAAMVAELLGTTNLSQNMAEDTVHKLLAIATQVSLSNG